MEAESSLESFKDQEGDDIEYNVIVILEDGNSFLYNTRPVIS